MRILLVGQAPNQHGDPTKPLTGRVGAKIAKLAGISTFRYLRRTERCNLLNSWRGKFGKGDAFPKGEAEVAASRMLPLLDGRRVIFVGKMVAEAFQVPTDELCRWSYSERLKCDFAILPHPSGIVRWWNSKDNVNLASAFLMGAFQPKEIR